MEPQMKSDIDCAVSAVVNQFSGQGHSEAVLQKALVVELQERGYVACTETVYPIVYLTSKGRSVIVGYVRIDIEVRSASLENPNMVILEIKKNTTGNHAAQLAKYEAVVPSRAGIALVNPGGITWNRMPSQ
tara:strand:- start:1072 stop:1464 length:393 start_codon:yes stop_codon:yes gene_type:complete